MGFRPTPRIVAAYAARRIPAGVQVDERVRDSRVLGSRAWQHAGGLNFVPVFRVWGLGKETKEFSVKNWEL